MDFLNKTYAQVVDLFRSLSVGARLVAAMLLAVVGISLAYLFGNRVAAPDDYLLGGEPFSASSLAPMQAAFAKAKLDGYAMEGNRVRVPRGQQAKYLAALADNNALPSSFGSYLQRAVADSSIWANSKQQAEKLKIAKQNELQDIILQMQGIEKASVLYDMQEKQGFSRERLVTASVSVKPAGSQPLDPDRVPALRSLVAGAIAGLKPENVTVIDTNGPSYPGGQAIDGLGSIQDDHYRARKLAYEHDWNAKIAGVLHNIPNVVVNTNVELTADISHEEESTVYESKSVNQSVKEKTTEETTRGGGGPGGRPGVVAQQPAVNAPASVATNAGPESVKSTSENEINSKVPTTVKRTKEHGLTPKRVTVSVAVPSSYYELVWRELNPPAAGAEPKKPTQQELDATQTKVNPQIQDAVKALLPILDPKVDQYPQIKITSFQYIPPKEIAAPSLQSETVSWLAKNWSTLGTFLLAMFGLVMLRSMIRSVPAPAPGTESSPAAIVGGPQVMVESAVAGADEPAAEGAAAKPSRIRRRGPGGPSLREELADLVKEDPDGAVNILRSWIGTAS